MACSMTAAVPSASKSSGEICRILCRDAVAFLAYSLGVIIIRDPLRGTRVYSYLAHGAVVFVLTRCVRKHAGRGQAQKQPRGREETWHAHGPTFPPTTF